MPIITFHTFDTHWRLKVASLSAKGLLPTILISKRLDCKFAKYLCPSFTHPVHAWAFSQSSTNHVSGPFTRNGHMARRNLAGGHTVCYTAVFSVVTQRSSTQTRGHTTQWNPWKEKIIAIWIIQWNPVNYTVTNGSQKNWPYKRVTAYRDGRKVGFRCNVISLFLLP